MKNLHLQVSKEYRTRVSERTDAEEQKRRKDKRTVTVIKYGESADSASTSAAKFEPSPTNVAPVFFPPPDAGVQVCIFMILLF